MGYLNENGLARYDGLIKNWTTFKSGTVDGIDPLLNWQRTETAGAVTFYPLPAAPIDPVVNFLFTETEPAEGTKGPDNPSTITGVSSITVTRCETVGVDSTDYTVNLNGTYYGGSVDLSVGTMTVTHVTILIDGDTIFATSGFVEYASTYKLQLTLNPARSMAVTSSDIASNRLPVFASTPSDSAGIYFPSASSLTHFVLSKTDINVGDGADRATVTAAYNSFFTNHPTTVIYPLATPYTVPLTPLQIYSLSQIDPYTPRINTVYSDQTSVQVGYPKSPQATATELTNAIISLGGEI